MWIKARFSAGRGNGCPLKTRVAKSSYAWKLIGRIWGIIALLYVLDIAGMLHYRLRLHTLPLLEPLMTLGALCGAALYQRVRRSRHEGVLYGLHVLNQFTFGALGLVVLSYLGAWLALPLIDPMLLRLDRALGFEWGTIFAWLDTQPGLIALSRFSYHVMNAEVIGALLLLGPFFGPRALHLFVLAALMSACCCIVIASLFPSLGAFVTSGLSLHAYPHIALRDIQVIGREMQALRAHNAPLLPAHLHGLVTFPSYHTAFAVVFILLLWHMRWRPLHLLIPLNVLMIASTPIDGAHYLTDTLAGIIIGSLAFFLARRLIYKAGDNPKSR